MATSTLFVGVMSGTSLDGADAVLVDLGGDRPRTLAFSSEPFSGSLRDALLALSHPGSDSLDASGRVSSELAMIYARGTQAVLQAAGSSARDVAAIGCHGQTVRHRPDEGFTIQLNDPARLAELTSIDVVADFRRRDMAAGGQGAPLVPAFHESVFRDPRIARVVVNIGGIGNITCLPRTGPILGFDCGPGNVLMDAWAQRHLGVPFDEDGRWAGTGTTDQGLLARLLAEPYLALPPPKSTGRELFHLAWLDARLPAGLQPADVQATLADFTARSVVEAIDGLCPGTEEIFLAGGGARNGVLVARIRALAGLRRVQSTDALGVPSGHVEALAFAWLAMKCIRRQPIDLASVTGARGARILGAIYPA